MNKNPFTLMYGIESKSVVQRTKFESTDFN